MRFTWNFTALGWSLFGVFVGIAITFGSLFLMDGQPSPTNQERTSSIRPILNPLPQHHQVIETLFPDIQQMRKEIEHERSLNFFASGGAALVDRNGNTVNITNKVVNYVLRSWDGGQNWYALDESDGQVKVLGTVDEVYPGLTQTLEFYDTLRPKRP